ncbi:MAG: hypothetical protein HY903_01780 [Deltaproteobacteria bacterium]|nr:hypothetical protein [Deltaproteobacteria bacterium]
MSTRCTAMLMVVFAVVACGQSGDEPDVPVATISLGGAALAGDVTVSFLVRDPASRLVNAGFRWGTSAATTKDATAAATSPIVLGLASSADGVPHTFVWDTVRDLGYAAHDTVYLSVGVTAGPISGIGDTVGPLVVDNTGLAQAYRVAGTVRRAPTLLGAPTADLAGKLYVGLFADTSSCPPLCALAPFANATLDLGAQDFSSPSAAVAYGFSAVPAGSYKIIALLDHNDNGIGGVCTADQGDLVNASDMAQDLHADYLQRDLVINYGIDIACP